MPRHRAINHFLVAYHDEWLIYEQSLGVQLIEEITGFHGSEEPHQHLLGGIDGTNALTTVPIAGMSPSGTENSLSPASTGTTTVGGSDGSAGSVGGNVEGGFDASAAIARAIMEASNFSESSDDGRQLF